jgi:hypothetical protein
MAQSKASEAKNPANTFITHLKISSSSWKTAEKGSKGVLKLEVPKMPKIAEFYRIYLKDEA